MISSFEMVKGGVILTALGSNNNQKSIKPCSWHLRMRVSAMSFDGIIKASMRPLPRISVIKGWIKSFLKSSSFSKVCGIKSLSITSCKVASADAAITG